LANPTLSIPILKGPKEKIRKEMSTGKKALLVKPYYKASSIYLIAGSHILPITSSLKVVKSLFCEVAGPAKNSITYDLKTMNITYSIPKMAALCIRLIIIRIEAHITILIKLF